MTRAGRDALSSGWGATRDLSSMDGKLLTDLPLTVMPQHLCQEILHNITTATSAHAQSRSGPGLDADGEELLLCTGARGVAGGPNSMSAISDFLAGGLGSSSSNIRLDSTENCYLQKGSPLVVWGGGGGSVQILSACIGKLLGVFTSGINMECVGSEDGDDSESDGDDGKSGGGGRGFGEGSVAVFVSVCSRLAWIQRTIVERDGE